LEEIPMAREDGSDPAADGGTGEDAGRLDQLFSKYLDRLNAGEEIDRLEIIANHPQEGEELLADLEAFLRIGPPPQEGAEASPCTIGDYTLRRRIGRGGMGVVYEAWENSMDRPVALKVLPSAVAADQRTFLRFCREARLAGKLHHPNIVGVFGMGIKGDTPHYAMELVEGETLAQVLARWKKGPPDTAAPFAASREDIGFYSALSKVFAGVADGLQHAHSKGVIHRDLKPSNLILERDVEVPSSAAFTLRILDFGLAHLEGQESLTAPGDFLGTPLYMSPEQARTKKIPVDHRTDIYSLGATLYEMLALRPPFQGKDHQDTLSQIIERDPVEPRKINLRIPRDLETIVLKCLRKDPADRYGTAEALGQDLRRFARADPVEARPESRWEKLSRRLRRNRTALTIAGVLSILFFGALGWQVWEKGIAEWKAREATLLLHDAAVRDAAIELYSGQLTLLGQDPSVVGSTLAFFRGRRFRKGPAGLQETLTTLEEAAQAVPERPDAPYYLALLYRLAGDDESAGREAARAVERSPDFVPADVLAREIALGQGSLPQREIEDILSRVRGKEGWQEP
jgi:serine/threonine protein kinase